MRLTPRTSPADAPPLDHVALLARIREIVAAQPRFGGRRVLRALVEEGWPVGPSLAFRLYREAGLQLHRPRIADAKGADAKAPPTTAVDGPGKHWCIDVVHERLGDRRIVRVINVVDAVTRECVAVDANLRVTAPLVTAVLDRAGTRRELPRSVTIDEGGGFAPRVMREWAARRGVHLDITRPASNADLAIESVSAALRDALRSPERCMTLRDLSRVLHAWRNDHNRRVLRAHDAVAVAVAMVPTFAWSFAAQTTPSVVMRTQSSQRADAGTPRPLRSIDDARGPVGHEPPQR